MTDAQWLALISLTYPVLFGAALAAAVYRVFVLFKGERSGRGIAYLVFFLALAEVALFLTMNILASPAEARQRNLPAIRIGFLIAVLSLLACVFYDWAAMVLYFWRKEHPRLETATGAAQAATGPPPLSANLGDVVALEVVSVSLPEALTTSNHDPPDDPIARPLDAPEPVNVHYEEHA
jgi:hypothetical protein